MRQLFLGTLCLRQPLRPRLFLGLFLGTRPRLGFSLRKAARGLGDDARALARGGDRRAALHLATLASDVGAATPALGAAAALAASATTPRTASAAMGSARYTCALCRKAPRASSTTASSAASPLKLSAVTPADSNLPYTLKYP